MRNGSLYDTIGHTYPVTRRTEPRIAAQIWAQSVQAQMIVRYFKGEAMDKVLDRAEREIEGFKRT